MLRSITPRHVNRPLRLSATARFASNQAHLHRPFEPSPQPRDDGGDAPKRSKGTFAPYLLGGLALGIGFYTFQLVIAARQPCRSPLVKDLSHQKDVAARYDETADSFDSEVGMSEALMGVNGIRDRLSKMCKGHVLEVSCGTGRNLGYYDLSLASKVDSLTFVDLSKQMVDVCKQKWSLLHKPTKSKPMKQGMVVRFLTGSALDAMPLAPGEKKYDTIIQTMGLCSTPSPHELLQNMALHLDDSNPDSKILLLEHGRSYQEWLNNILDNSAEKHAEIHGCWYNRDIGTLVQEAADRSGLEVVRERRHHLGTTWVFELKPKVIKSKADLVRLRASDSPKAAEEKDAVVEGSQAYGWRALLPWKRARKELVGLADLPPNHVYCTPSLQYVYSLFTLPPLHKDDTPIQIKDFKTGRRGQPH